MRIGVCGIACEVCPRMTSGSCPNGEGGCVPRTNKFCTICTCAFEKGMRYCFECDAFPRELTKEGPIDFGYCQYLAGRRG